MQAMYAIARHRHLIDPRVLDGLIFAALDKIDDSDNFLPNRKNLARLIRDFGDVMSTSLATAVADRLMSVPDQQESDDVLKQINHPLSPFKFNMGTYSSLVGEVVITLASLIEFIPGSAQRAIVKRVDRLLASSDIELRRSGIIAAYKLPALEEHTINSLLLLTRDPAPEIASNAFAALGHKPLELSEDQRLLVLQSVTFGSQSPDASVRSNAAFAALNISASLTGCELASIDAVVQSLRQDISYRVRDA